MSSLFVLFGKKHKSEPFSSDCSITPDCVGANTYSTAIAIGEKAAVIIAEDLGIKGITSD